MLEIYAASVLIFTIVILSLSAIFRNAHIKNGWVVEPMKAWTVRVYNALLLAAVPILRVFAVVMLLCMVTFKREDLDEMMEERKNED